MKKVRWLLYFSILFSMLLGGSALAEVLFTGNPEGPADCVYVAGNPDFYPLEKYDPLKGEYEGVLPKILNEISLYTGIDFVYVSAGSRNKQEQLAKNRQVDLLTAYEGTPGDWCISEENVFSFEQDGKKYDVKLCFTDAVSEENLKRITDAFYEIPRERIHGFVMESTAKKQSIFHNDYKILGVALAVFALGAAGAVIACIKQRNYHRRSEVDKWTDKLTGTGNRQYFVERFNSLVNEDNRSFLHLAYYSFDIDWVNRCIGPDQAEQLLIKIAESFPKEDARHITARVAGGGIANLFESGSRDTAVRVAEDYLGRFNQLAKEITGSGETSVCAGLLPLKTISCSGENALKYVSGVIRKKQTADVVLCTSAEIQKTEENEKLLAGMEASIEKGEFEIYVQPFFRYETGKYCGGEVLCRWNTQSFGLLKPARFMELVADRKLAEKFDYKIFEKACQCLQSWSDAGHPDLLLSCNFSRETMAKPDFLERLEAEVQKYSFARDRLMIEITEAEKENSSALLENNVKGLRELGFRIALDDFGTGYSTFMSLYAILPDYIKLGRTYVEKIDEEQDRCIFRSLTGFVHGLGVQLICEGVETAGEDTFVRQCGCDYAQGYYYARPMPPEETIKIILAGN